MRKLISYKYNGLFPFGDGEYYTSYTLTLLKYSFFGLIKKEIKQNYNVSMFGSIKEHEAHWDELIKTGQRFK